MADITAPTVPLPATALNVALTAARRELSRLRGWEAKGVGYLGDEANELEPAIAAAEEAAGQAAGGLAPLPTLTAATLRFYATRELGRLSGMGMLWGDGDPDLGRQADELRAALAHIPFTLAPVNVPPPAANTDASPEGAAANG